MVHYRVRADVLYSGFDAFTLRDLSVGLLLLPFLILRAASKGGMYFFPTLQPAL